MSPIHGGLRSQTGRGDFPEVLKGFRKRHIVISHTSSGNYYTKTSVYRFPTSSTVTIQKIILSVITFLLCYSISKLQLSLGFSFQSEGCFCDCAHPLCVMSLRKTSDEANIKAEVKAEVTQIPEVGETEPKNTQENGPSPDVVVQTGKTTPRKLEENSTRAQDEDVMDSPADSGRAELLNCTLNSPQSDHAAAGWEVFTPEEEEKPAVPQDKIPDSSSVNPKVCCENQPETNTTRERVTLATAHDSEEEEGSKAVDNAAAEPSGEFSQNKEVLSVPNTQPTAAAYQPSSEIDRESPSW